MDRLSISHNRSSLSSENIELEGGHMGFVPIKRTSIRILVGVGTGNMAKSSTL
jgi:hypothetical protein